MKNQRKKISFILLPLGYLRFQTDSNKYTVCRFTGFSWKKKKIIMIVSKLQEYFVLVREKQMKRFSLTSYKQIKYFLVMWYVRVSIFLLFARYFKHDMDQN